MRTILNLLLILIIAVIGYNYFFGNQSEQSESREIVNQVKDLGRSVGDLIISEKEQFDKGKYDGLVDQMRTVLDKIKSQLETGDGADKQRWEGLEEELKEIEQEVRQSDEDSSSNQQKDALQERLNQLLEKAERLLDSTSNKNG